MSIGLAIFLSLVTPWFLAFVFLIYVYKKEYDREERIVEAVTRYKQEYQQTYEVPVYIAAKKVKPSKQTETHKDPEPEKPKKDVN